MKLWRVANRQFRSLDGLGGVYVGGRWHTAGRQIVYTAEHPALAALEVLVHMDMELGDLPEYILLEIHAPDDLPADHINCDPTDTTITSKFGNEWIASGKTALCKVPSAVMPSSYNYLLNPNHPKAHSIEVFAEMPFEFDGRLFG